MIVDVLLMANVAVAAERPLEAIFKTSSAISAPVNHCVLRGVIDAPALLVRVKVLVEACLEVLSCRDRHGIVLQSGLLPGHASQLLRTATAPRAGLDGQTSLTRCRPSSLTRHDGF